MYCLLDRFSHYSVMHFASTKSQLCAIRELSMGLLVHKLEIVLYITYFNLVSRRRRIYLSSTKKISRLVSGIILGCQFT